MEKEQLDEIGRRLKQIAAELSRLLAEVQSLRSRNCSSSGEGQKAPHDSDVETKRASQNAGDHDC